MYLSQGSVAMCFRCGGIFNRVSLCIYCGVWRWNNFENHSTFSEVMDKNQVSCLFLCSTFCTTLYVL